MPIWCRANIPPTTSPLLTRSGASAAFRAIDQHIYARENGWAINALATFYGVTGDESALAEAIRAAEWIVTNRSLPDGGFRHDADNSGGPYLGDSISMARAFLKLYAVTGDRVWLSRAEDATMFIETKFKCDVGYVAFVQPLAKLKPRPHVDENAAVARIVNLLRHYTGKRNVHAKAEHAMHFLGAPAVGENRGYEVAGILLADEGVGGLRCISPSLAQKTIRQRVALQGRNRAAGQLQAR